MLAVSVIENLYNNIILKSEFTVPVLMNTGHMSKTLFLQVKHYIKFHEICF